MAVSPIECAISFWRPLLDEEMLQALATYRHPSEPRVPGINAWRPDSERRHYRILDGAVQFSIFAAVDPMASAPESAEILAHILDRSGKHYSYVLGFPDEGSVVVPFDPNAVVESFLREEYVHPAKRTVLPRPLLSLYYSIVKPILGAGAKGRLRRLVARRTYTGERFLEWPSDESHDLLQRLLLRLMLVVAGAQDLRFAWFWPDGRPWAAVLTHDVETAGGLAQVPHVAGLEREKGMRSSFNLVPFDYEVPGSLLEGLREADFEIGVHGYTHDGVMFSRWRTFLERVVAVNEIGRRWGASGFRSPATYRNQEWFHLLDYEYDSSVADNAPFEPQPGGCASFFPYLAGGLVELPITLAQDHTLFTLLGQVTSEMWLTKLQQIERSNGMACILTHPDSARGYIGLPENEAFYLELLDSLVESDAWIPLPRDLARWWRARSATPSEELESLEGLRLGKATLDPFGALCIAPPARDQGERPHDPTLRTVAPKRPIRVWIDMANSPHVQFFGPLIRELESRGHSVVITAREYAQTTELLDKARLPYTTVGHHGGKSLLGKALAIEGRARSLAEFARENQVDIAVHHNSYAQSIAAWARRIPSITLMDYEYQPANHIGFRLSDIVLVPDSISADALAPYGASWRLRRYSGLKEDFYVSTMVAAENDDLGVAELDTDLPLLVLRPPPDLAAYHRFENLLWAPLLEYLSIQQEAAVLVVPRTKAQASRLAPLIFGNVVIAERAIAPATLLGRADGVITAGGTMAREAAALGIPAYTIFAGRRGGVDTRLINEGRLVEISTPEDFALISLKRRQHGVAGSLERERERVSWLADLVVRVAG